MIFCRLTDQHKSRVSLLITHIHSLAADIFCDYPQSTKSDSTNHIPASMGLKSKTYARGYLIADMRCYICRVCISGMTKPCWRATTRHSIVQASVMISRLRSDVA